MRYEIRYEINRVNGVKMVVAESDESAIAKFREDWAADGDEFTGSCWVAGRWAIGG